MSRVPKLSTSKVTAPANKVISERPLGCLMHSGTAMQPNDSVKGAGAVRPGQQSPYAVARHKRPRDTCKLDALEGAAKASTTIRLGIHQTSYPRAAWQMAALGNATSLAAMLGSAFRGA